MGEESRGKIHFNIQNVMAITEEFDHYIYLESIVVKEESRNKGLGTRILLNIIAYAKERRKPLVLLATGELGGDVEKLNKWYKKNGFYEETNVMDTMYNYNFRKNP